jgi:hypothetical protein
MVSSSTADALGRGNRAGGDVTGLAASEHGRFRARHGEQAEFSFRSHFRLAVRHCRQALMGRIGRSLGDEVGEFPLTSVHPCAASQPPKCCLALATEMMGHAASHLDRKRRIDPNIHKAKTGNNTYQGLSTENIHSFGVSMSRNNDDTWDLDGFQEFPGRPSANL